MTDISKEKRAELTKRIHDIRSREMNDFTTFMKEYGVIGIVGSAEGGDDEGYVNSVVAVTSDGMLPIQKTHFQDMQWVTVPAHEFYSTPFMVIDSMQMFQLDNSALDVPANVETDAHSMIRRMASILFNDAYPTYGTGERSVYDIFVVKINNGEPVLRMTSADTLSEAAELMMNKSGNTPCTP